MLHERPTGARARPPVLHRPFDRRVAHPPPLLKILPTRKPGVSLGTRKSVVPSRTLTFGFVRARTKNSLATLPFAMKHFSPFRIHSSPLRSARSFTPALGSSSGRGRPP